MSKISFCMLSTHDARTSAPAPPPSATIAPGSRSSAPAKAFWDSADNPAIRVLTAQYWDSPGSTEPGEQASSFDFAQETSAPGANREAAARAWP
jgi:hypothetical protein